MNSTGRTITIRGSFDEGVDETTEFATSDCLRPTPCSAWEYVKWSGMMVADASRCTDDAVTTIGSWPYCARHAKQSRKRA